MEFISVYCENYCIGNTLFGKNAGILNVVGSKGKGKAIPFQALTGLEGSRKLRLPDFMTIGT
jgi:hypothetical protein